MSLPNGHYRTAAGSTVEVFGRHSGGVRVGFDWLVEPEAFNAGLFFLPEGKGWKAPAGAYKRCGGRT